MNYISQAHKSQTHSHSIDDVTRSTTSGFGREGSGDGVSGGPMGPTRTSRHLMSLRSQHTSDVEHGSFYSRRGRRQSDLCGGRCPYRRRSTRHFWSVEWYDGEAHTTPSRWRIRWDLRAQLLRSIRWWWCQRCDSGGRWLYRKGAAKSSCGCNMWTLGYKCKKNFRFITTCKAHRSSHV